MSFKVVSTTVATNVSPTVLKDVLTILIYPCTKYERTRDKINNLTASGYNVVEMWECEWNHIKQNNEEVKNFVNSLEIVTPPNPREAFFGGRTNAIKLYHKVEGNEKIHCYDMTSLYPSANVNCNYPIGHP